jgi:hypothetical protein
LKTEELGWLRLASHLGMSLDEVKTKTSASQFVLWMEYLEWDINAFDKRCYYLAQIAAEIRRSYVKRGVTVRLQDFIMKFQREEPIPPPSKGSGTQMPGRIDRIKQHFFSLTGLLGKRREK